MKQYKQTGIAGKDEILFLPLGGTGEIGMNLNLYGHDGQWLMIDCGITFGDANMPGVEIVLPDISFVEDNRDRLVGLVLTHAHEDHLGAVHICGSVLAVQSMPQPLPPVFCGENYEKN